MVKTTSFSNKIKWDLCIHRQSINIFDNLISKMLKMFAFGESLFSFLSHFVWETCNLYSLIFFFGLLHFYIQKNSSKSNIGMRHYYYLCPANFCYESETSADAQHRLWQMAMCKNMYLFCPWPSCTRMFTL